MNNKLYANEVCSIIKATLTVPLCPASLSDRSVCVDEVHQRDPLKQHTVLALRNIHVFR